MSILGNYYIKGFKKKHDCRMFHEQKKEFATVDPISLKPNDLEHKEMNGFGHK